LLIQTKQNYQDFYAKNKKKVIGLVPTMGAIHEGHVSLMKKSMETCDLTIVTIFVNPTQFNNPKDLEKYPRTLDNDLDIIRNVSTNIIVFAPNVNEIYPDGVTSKSFDFGNLSEFMEGKHRKGHFDGVGTVLEKLFYIIKPSKSFFGEKDFQQLAIVKKLVEILELDIEIVGCETLREGNGLAKSSRNMLLSLEEQQKASEIYKSLITARDSFETMTIQDIKVEVRKRFENIKDFELEYFEIAAEQDLIPTETKKPDVKYRGFISAFLNKVRLIDNMALN
jgi:pantoate--beta-alanine ligase